MPARAGQRRGFQRRARARWRPRTRQHAGARQSDWRLTPRHQRTGQWRPRSRHPATAANIPPMTAPASAPARVRILIVDDSEMVRMGLRTLLGTEPLLEIVGEAANVLTGVEAAAQLTPDVVLLDIRLPDGTGLDACRQIRKRSPGTRVLMLTSVIDESVVDDAIRAGAHGYLLKEIDGRGLVSAVRDV